MGRSSRGGLTTKIHALVDAYGLPILLKLTEGQAHDGRSAQDMLGTPGRGDVVLADRAYDSDALRQDLATRGARANVRLMPNRVNLPPFSKKSSIASAIRSSGSSINSSISALSPPDTTSATTTTAPPSNSPQHEFRCALMSLWPSVLENTKG